MRRGGGDGKRDSGGGRRESGGIEAGAEREAGTGRVTIIEEGLRSGEIDSEGGAGEGEGS